MIYEGFQLNEKLPLSENVKQAIALYQRKHGEPPNILETPLKDVPLPEGMSMIVKWINLPNNILLVGKVE